MTLSNCHDYIAQLVRDYPLEGDTRYGLAMALIRSGQYDEAAEALQPLLDSRSDDIAVNLKPAGDMGMRTVWIRTEESVKRADGIDLIRM